MKLKGFPDLSPLFMIRKIIAGLRNLTPSNDQWPKITLPRLQNIISYVPNALHCEYDIHMFRAMFVLAFYACLRVWELCNIKELQCYTLQRQNFSFSHDYAQAKYPAAMEITFHSYKHSIPSYQVFVFCFAGAHHYFALSEKSILHPTEGINARTSFPWLIWSSQPISKQDFIKIMHETFALSRFIHTPFESHACCIGGSTY